MKSPASSTIRRTGLAALVTLATLFVAGPAFAVERPFGPAETLSFECRYLGLPVGKVNVIVGADTKINGRNVWPMMAVAKTDPLFVLYPIHDKYISWWDPEAGLTIGNELMAEEKNVRRRERVRFDRTGNRAATVRESQGRPRAERDYDVPAGAQDILAALFAVRALPLEPGDHEELPIFTGRKVFSLKVDVVGKEQVKTKAGSFETKVLQVAVEFSGDLASKRDMRVYVTDDERHLPVRMDAEFLIGTLAADLVSFQKGLTR